MNNFDNNDNKISKRKVGYLFILIIPAFIFIVLGFGYMSFDGFFVGDSDKNQSNIDDSKDDNNWNDQDSNETENDLDENDETDVEDDVEDDETDETGDESDVEKEEEDDSGNNNDDSNINNNTQVPDDTTNDNSGNNNNNNNNNNTVVPEVPKPVNYTVVSISEMINLSSLKVGDTVTTLSYHRDLHCGGAKYEIVSSINSSIDNANVFKLDNGLYAKFSSSNGVMNIDQYGIHGDGTTNDADIINYAISRGTVINLKQGDYLLDSPISINNIDNYSFVANNSNFIITDKLASDSFIFMIDDSNNVQIDSFKVTSTVGNTNLYSEVLRVVNSSNINITNNNISDFNSEEVFKFINSSNVTLSNNTINHDFKRDIVLFNDMVNLVDNNNIFVSSSNGSVIDLFTNVMVVTNNIVTIDSKLNTIFNYQDITLSKAVTISGNTINYNYDEIGNDTFSNFVKINNTKLNNFIVDISNNVVTGSQINDEGYMLIYNSLDTNKQTINLNNNNIDNYHKRYVIGAEVVSLSVLPRVDVSSTSVSTMKINTNLVDGDIVKTIGFYEGKTTGSSYYMIVDSTDLVKDEIEAISLTNGKYAIMYNTGGAVSVNQFGAYGDGVNGDVDALNAAFDSGYENIYLETGTYILEKLLLLEDVSHVNFDGRNNLIFFDNSVDIVSDRTQRDDPKFSEFSFKIINSSYIDFVNLNMENIASNHDLKQLAIMRSGNISISNSRFYSPVDVFNTNIDLYTDWENIVIHNNDLIVEGDTAAGGNIWVRDVQKGGCYNADITNNYVYKQAHDELVAIFQGEVHDVYIAGNEFISEEGVNSETSIMNIRLGSESNTAVSGIVFENNELTIQAKMGAIWGDVATDTIVRNNIINFTKVDNSVYGYVIDGNSHSSGPDGRFAIYENNTLNLKADSDDQTIYVYSDIDLLKNDVVNIDNAFTTLYGHINRLEENSAYINNVGERIFNDIIHASDNYVQINDYMKNIFTILSLSEPVVYENNVIDYMYDQVITTASEFTVITLNNISLNGHSVTFTNNTLNHDKANLDSSLLFANLKDTTEQNIHFHYNDFAGYTVQKVYPSENRHLYNIEILE